MIRKVVLFLLVAALMSMGALPLPTIAHNEEFTLSSDFGTKLATRANYNDS